ncbi:hypothetical protein [Phocaeicola plebeius]|uniref:hypothetical protein n=1 Tax=Phocaeicola plebeius TaxID=310297 RepID=UPI001959AC47|nr:hypothetical protein [Phocaeicola plebeius]MBM6845071.1 hypothetical protein [Phocaeicola plebeius]
MRTSDDVSCQSAPPVTDGTEILPTFDVTQEGMQCYASVHILPYGLPYATCDRDVLLPMMQGCRACGNAGQDAPSYKTHCPVACHESEPENEYSPTFKKL